MTLPGVKSQRTEMCGEWKFAAYVIRSIKGGLHALHWCRLRGCEKAEGKSLEVDKK